MERQKWFRNRSFIVMLLSALGAALLAAAEQLTRKIRSNHKKGGKRTPTSKLKV